MSSTADDSPKAGAAKQRRAASASRSKRSAARLAAVQALYQMKMTGISADAVIVQFCDSELGRQLPDIEPGQFDRGLFSRLVSGVAGKREDIDRIVGMALTGDWTVERLEIILLCILEAGTYELTERPDVPPRVTISEYVDVAHAFYSGAEPGLVNGVLDKLAHKFRDQEMTAGRG